MTAETQIRTLTAQDRCDRCSAAARVVATFLFGELMFCGHHAIEQKKALQEKAISLLDPDKFLGEMIESTAVSRSTI